MRLGNAFAVRGVLPTAAVVWVVLLCIHVWHTSTGETCGPKSLGSFSTVFVGHHSWFLKWLGPNVLGSFPIVFVVFSNALPPIPLDPSSMSTDFVGHDTFLLAWLRLNFPRSISTDFGGHRSLYFENAWPQFPWFHFYEFRWPSLIIFECVWPHISLGPFLRASLAIAHCIPKMACPQLPQVQFYRFPWPTFFVWTWLDPNIPGSISTCVFGHQYSF